MLARHVSDLTGPSSGAFCTSCIRRFGMWYYCACRVVRVRVYLVGLHIYIYIYIILLIVNVSFLTRKMKLNIQLVVSFVFTSFCAAPCFWQFLRAGTNIPVRKKTIDESCAEFFNSADETVGGGW